MKTKVTSEEDLLGLVKLAHGQDPSWRFVTLSQLIELKESLSRYASNNQQLQILKGDQKALRQLFQSISLIDKYALAKESIFAQKARERREAWEAGRCTEFDDAPIGLRYTFNAIFSADGHQVNDFSSSHRSKKLTDLLALAKNRKLVVVEDTGDLALEEMAKVRVRGSFKSQFIRPHRVEALQVPLGLKKVPEQGFGQQILDLVSQDLATLSGRTKLVAAAHSLSDMRLPLVSREFFIERVTRELEEKRDNTAISIPDLKQALGMLANPSDKEKKAGIKLLRLMASYAQDTSEKERSHRITVTPFMLDRLLPELAEVKFAHSHLITILKVTLVPSKGPAESSRSLTASERRVASRVDLLQQFQRAVLPVVGRYIERDKASLSPKVLGECRSLLLHHTHPLQPASNISTALYWVHRNRALFSDSELSSATVKVVTELDRSQLLHGLFISARMDRKEKGVQMAGALEVIIDLLQEGRLSKELGVTVYASLLEYLRLRRRSLAETQCRFQRGEAAEMLETLNSLCDGVPKTKLEESGVRAQSKSARRPRSEGAAKQSKQQREREFLAGVMNSLSEPQSS
jgi:hypothetical protein